MSSTEMPAVLASHAAEISAEAQAGTSEGIETALGVLFIVAAVLCVSFIAVVTALV